MTHIETRPGRRAGITARTGSTPETKSQPNKTTGRRPDVQGLRALAVIVVIADHLLAWPDGGFIGVDVFFVISGFLITGLLYREYESTGRISFANFYRRRVRRIIPISTLVILVTVLASYLIYLSSRATAVGVDALWALLFSMNWHLAAVGTNYWANDTAVSPLQHYWSLAVEEQFYLFWPWVLVAILTVGVKLAWTEGRRRRVLLTAMTVVTCASFGWALLETATRPTWAYFSTFSRAWELGVGAILAVAASTWARLPASSRPFIAWIGLSGIVASLFLVSESNAFPAPWAALPVVSTALVIVAGTGGTQKALAPLTNRASVYVGNISYSLYLWHFPVLILLASILPVGPLYYVVAIVVMTGLSIFSYHEIEEPIRTSAWLERKAAGHKGSTSPLRRQWWRGQMPRRRQLSLTTLLSCATVLMIALAYQNSLDNRQGSTMAAAPRTTEATPAPTPKGAKPMSPAVTDQAKQVTAALLMQEFPSLDPAVNDLGTEGWINEIGTCQPV